MSLVNHFSSVGELASAETSQKRLIYNASMGVTPVFVFQFSKYVKQRDTV